MAKKKRGLPAKYARMGFAKGWKAYRKDYPYKKSLYTVGAYKKTYKGRTTKRKVVGVKKVARKRRYSRKKYRRKKPKIPLETMVALGAIPFTPAKNGWATPLACAQDRHWEGIGENLKQGFLGINTDGSFDLFSTLNPFDMNSARYTKMLIMSGVISKFRKKLVRIPFDKVPLIGKYIS